MPQINSRNLTQWLLRYFDHWERTLSASGYSPTNVLSQDWSHGQMGHRILIPDMPFSLRIIERTIASLPDEQEMVVYAKFGLHRDAKGKPYTNEAKAEALGISMNTYKSRWSYARKNLLRVLGKI